MLDPASLPPLGQYFVRLRACGNIEHSVIIGAVLSTNQILLCCSLIPMQALQAAKAVRRPGNEANSVVYLDCIQSAIRISELL